MVGSIGSIESTSHHIMNEPIISHKKSLRVGRLTKDRELLLNSYQQDDSTAPASSDPVVAHHSDSDPLTTHSSDTQERVKDGDEEGTITEDCGENSNDDDITNFRFKELIQTHNKLLGKEQATNNLIKSTIYDNYYDLVRVNTSLAEFIDPQGDINTLWDKLKRNLS